MYAILGILNITPSTGYDIKKYCDTVLTGFWNENYGHIYPTLKVLSDKGMISTVEQQESDGKIQYQITEKGKEELNCWLLENTEPQPMRSEFMLKFIFSSNQSSEQIKKMLMDYKALHEKKIEKYQEMLEKLQNGEPSITPERKRFLRAVLRRGVLSDQAVIDWCEETLGE